MSLPEKRIKEIVRDALKVPMTCRIRHALSLAVGEDDRVVTVEWMHAIHDTLGEPCECKHPYLCRPCGLKKRMAGWLEGDSHE